MRCEEIFGLMKTLVDAHTMGIDAAVSLLRECNYKVIVSPLRVQKALETLESEESQRIILDWIKSNKINHIGVSYRSKRCRQYFWKTGCAIKKGTIF